MPKTTDVAIVGGGVIGCSIAYYLSQQGIKSTVFERTRFAAGASGATAGIVAPLWYVDPSVEAYFALGLKSLETFPALRPSCGRRGSILSSARQESSSWHSRPKMSLLYRTTSSGRGSWDSG